MQKNTPQKVLNFEEAIRQTAMEIANLVISKQRDYGPKNIVNSPFGPEQGLVTREHDKLARLANLLGKSKNPNNESIEDTWKDVAGYGLIGVMIRRGIFELPLKEE